MGGSSSKHKRNRGQPPQQAQQAQAQQRQNALLAQYGVNNVQAIMDRFTTYQEVTDALRKSGLEVCSLMFGIDYTLSNNTQGQRTFGGRSLHALNPQVMNPYQQVICYLGETLEPFDDDGMIPVFGFGDVQTKGNGVFPLKAEGACHGSQEVLSAYTAVTPHVQLSGPTNFAPLIYKAIEVVKQTKAYHVLVIVADGQVTNEKDTIDAIVAASAYPLSIVMVGVGDGPWEGMRNFDDRIPRRQFDNFQFVDFYSCTTQSTHPQASFALQALMEIPDQFLRIRQLNLFSNC